MQLLTAEDYYQDLLKNIPKAKKRIAITALIIQSWGRTATLFEEISKALARGVKVTLVPDIYTQHPVSYDTFIKNPTVKKHMRETTETFKNLQTAEIIYWGKMGLNPFKKRLHVKATVIDDEVYSFGGVNFNSPSFAVVDYMLKTTDRALADKIEKLISDIATGRDITDFADKLDSKNTLLYDSGRPKKSIIYDTALGLAQKSRKIYYISQMCPSGRLAKNLKTKDCTFYFNRPRLFWFPASLQQITDQARYRLDNSYYGGTFLHAKFMLFELEDGQKALISGSHNFVWRGVAYGTKEIALLSYDENLWWQLFNFKKQKLDK